jgi:predicted transcriptional regulator
MCLRLQPCVCHTVRMMSGQRGTSKSERVDVRVDDETKKLLDDLAALYRSNRSHVVRLAVAELARAHGILGSTREARAHGAVQPVAREEVDV